MIWSLWQSSLLRGGLQEASMLTLIEESGPRIGRTLAVGPGVLVQLRLLCPL